jgi:hypothetical protein
MIKFFRKIRQNLLTENKFSKYLIYAIGEIVLVVIGILIALGINNWNQQRLSSLKEIQLLLSLKEELETNKLVILKTDTLYVINESNAKKGLRLFEEKPSLNRFMKINSLISPNWTTFRVNRSTYDEMLNNGTFYSLKNKQLKEQIREHYTEAQNSIAAFQEMNSNGQLISYKKELYIVDLLEDKLAKEKINIKGIDTSWIYNPSSPTYLSLYRKALYTNQTSTVRRLFIEDYIKNGDKLIEAIDKELQPSY